VYRPDTTPRPADTVCPADRYRLERDLLAVARLYHRLDDGEDPIVDDCWYEARDSQGRPTGEWRRRDPLAVFDGAGAIGARSTKPSVTGTRSAPVPINVDALDLIAPARNAAPLGEPGDQIGYLPVATVLDRWCRHVRDVLHPEFHLPKADVDALVDALHRDLDDICDKLPGVLAHLAEDLRALGSAMRVILRETEPVPQPLLGVRCEHCKTMSTLVPWTTGEYTECKACGQLYTPTDREELTRRQLADVRRPRTVRLSGMLPNLA
jgi:hypothetical protein